MSDTDDEFDDFLRRRKPVFRRSTEDPFEPPEELDRIVLRQAREAIERERPERVYQGPRWGMPVALAASLLLVFSVVLHFGARQQAPEPVAEVTVQTISQEFEYPTAPAAPGSFASADEGTRHAAPAQPPVPPMSTADRARLRPADGAEPAVASAAPTPAWRRDAASWRAEIERLRAAGRTAEADAEQAEFQRQQRAYAGSPDQ